MSDGHEEFEMANPYQHGQLRRARESIGLTQAGVAERLAELAWTCDREHVGVNPDMVAKWERGVKHPLRIYERLLCLLFDATPADLGLAPAGAARDGSVVVPAARQSSDVPWAEILLALGAPGQLLHRFLIEDWETELLKRRELLKSMGLAAIASTLGSLPPPVSRAVRLNGDLRPDPVTVDGLAELAATFQRMYHDTSPHTLLTPIKAHLRTVDELLRSGAEPRERRRLLANQSQVAMLAGRLAFFDLRDPLSARGYLTTAYDSAVAAADAPLMAGALGHLAFVPASSGQWSAAADHLSRAAAHAERGAPPVVRSWLAAVASEMRANAGDERGSRTSIDDAKRLGSMASDAPSPLWFDFYDSSRLHGFEGYALLRSGSAGPASRVLEHALDGLPSSAVKQRTVFLTDLATTHIQRGDVEKACDLAVRAATDARARQYATCVTRLREFRSSLRPFATSRAVRELDHAMVDL